MEFHTNEASYRMSSSHGGLWNYLLQQHPRNSAPTSNSQRPSTHFSYNNINFFSACLMFFCGVLLKRLFLRLNVCNSQYQVFYIYFSLKFVNSVNKLAQYLHFMLGYLRFNISPFHNITQNNPSGCTFSCELRSNEKIGGSRQPGCGTTRWYSDTHLIRDSKGFVSE